MNSSVEEIGGSIALNENNSGQSAQLKAVLVVIPTLNERSHIKSVLISLSEDLPAGRKVAFVVADGGSTDGTQAIVEWLAKTRCQNLYLLINPERLQSAGINRAVEAFGGEFDVLVRCDAHAIYPKGYIAALLTTLEATKAHSVVVPMDSVGKTCFQKAVAWLSDTPLGSGGSAHRAGRRSGFVDHGHNAAMLINAFRAAGGYDPSYSHNEDAEFDCRLVRIGGRIWLTADVRLTYFPRATMTALMRQYFCYGRGRSRTVRRHPGSMRLRQAAVPSHCAMVVLTFLVGLFIFPWLLLYPAAYAGALFAGAGLIAMRHRSPCGLLVAPAAFAMHMAWACGFFVGFLTIREKPWRPRDLAERG